MPWRRAIPIGLTLTRLLLAGAFPLAPAGWRMGLLALGLATEFLDGFLARRLRGTSELGRVLDPVADKLFVLAVVATLLAEGMLAPGAAALVLARDLTILLGASGYFLSGGRRDRMPRVQPTVLGKTTTAFQLAFLIGLLALERGGAWLLPPTAALSLAAALDYLWRHRDALLPWRRDRLPPPAG